MTGELGPVVQCDSWCRVYPGSGEYTKKQCEDGKGFAVEISLFVFVHMSSMWVPLTMLSVFNYLAILGDGIF